MSTTVRFADGFDRPDTIAFGLEGPQLAVIALGAGVVWGLLHSPLPGAPAALLAALVGLLAAVLGAARWAGRPLLTWAWVAARFWLGPRRGGLLLADGDEGAGTDAGGDGTAASGGASLSDVSGGAKEAARGVVSGGPAAASGGAPGGRGPDDEEPGWARWLREGRARPHGRRRDANAPAVPHPTLRRSGGASWWIGRVGTDAPASEMAAPAPPGGGAAGVDPLVSSAPELPPSSAPANPVAMWLAALRAGQDGDAQPPQTARVRRVKRAEVSDRPVWPGPHARCEQPDAGAETSTPSLRPQPMTAARRWLGRILGDARAGASATARPTTAPSAEPATAPAPAPIEPVPTSEPAPAGHVHGRTIELDRPPLVLLPTSGGEPGDGGTPTAPDVEEPAPAAATDDGTPALATVIPLLQRLDEFDEELMLELAEGQAEGGGGFAVAQRDQVSPAQRAQEDPSRNAAVRGQEPPVFVGATRRITFFSLNGGSGRTTLATEVACLLAARGKHRPDPDGPVEPLRVALVDLDLRASNVAVRLGIAHPTLWDYLMATGDDAEDVRRFLVRHPSGLRALLGPPKPLSTVAAPVEPARIAEIVHQLERDGCHFIVFDIGSDLGAVSTWVLSQAHDIYVVITQSASGLQDAYRTTETLRRLGLGHKLRYVVNRAKGNVDVAEVMGDLGGRITATIPYDQRLEEAENTHTIASLRGGGPGADAIFRLATTVYPPLGGGRGRRGLLGRRRAG